ncbi:B-cell CLL/lymphoma 9-like protein [Scyliorhinus canicula]|uniref:B-cell CLL/lymphoma 9-like protein n=1 Tax=Scyliorhinus canicula TaxID=7830 RepID=UPI0018F61784|nr:B-cell CLL/lymphoma 9-like protein [Scyliorhinus canicula]
MMSQMSKYAMPSSTPLYHDAIKTIATSDDELIPVAIDAMIQPSGVPGLSGNQNAQMHLVSQSGPGSGSANSPLAMGMVGQPLSHEPPTSMMPSPQPDGAQRPDARGAWSWNGCAKPHDGAPPPGPPGATVWAPCLVAAPRRYLRTP